MQTTSELDRPCFIDLERERDGKFHRKKHPQRQRTVLFELQFETSIAAFNSDQPQERRQLSLLLR